MTALEAGKPQAGRPNSEKLHRAPIGVFLQDKPWTRDLHSCNPVWGKNGSPSSN